MQNLFIFGAIILIILWVSDRILTKKFNIKKEKGFYTHVNSSHKWGEALIVAISLVLLFIHTFVMDITGPLKPNHFILALILGYIFRMFMELMYERDSRRYLRSILYAIFFNIVCWV